MILTDLTHAAQQIPITPSFKQALAFIHAVKNKEMPDGRIDINGSDVFAWVQSYETETKDGEPVFEIHRKYVDVQYMSRGEEIIGWAPVDQLAITVPYDEPNDTSFGTLAMEKMTPLHLCAGQLALFFPTDGHAARRVLYKPVCVKKIVVKVALEQ
jgi:YhcH/YjgK/YiaL family protein